jgi:hypothetical protein
MECPNCKTLIPKKPRKQRIKKEKPVKPVLQVVKEPVIICFE